MKKSRLYCIVGTASCIAIFALCACGNSTSNTGMATGGTTPTKANTAIQHFKVGQQVKVDSTWLATLDNAKTSTGVPGIEPKDGDVYLAVIVTMKNISRQEQSISSLVNFSLQDSSGHKYTEAIDFGAGIAAHSKVEAGSRINGLLVYEVPTLIHQFTFLFVPDITGSRQTIWDIKV